MVRVAWPGRSLLVAGQEARTQQGREAPPASPAGGREATARESQFAGVAFVLVSALITLAVVHWIRAGRMRRTMSTYLTREREPRSFWIHIGILIAFAAFGFAVGLNLIFRPH